MTTVAERRVTQTIDLLPRVVHVHEGLTPLRARAINLGAVTGALATAGLEHFVVRGTEDRTSVVAVREDQRAAVLTSLRKLGRESAAYVAPVLPVPPVRDVLGEAGTASSWRKPGQAKVLRLIWFRTDPARTLVYDREYGCDIEFWKSGAGGALAAPRPNRVTSVVASDASPVQAPAEPFSRLGGPLHTLPPVRTRREMTAVLPDDVGFPIDVVYTWVADEARCLSSDMLRYSLRSVHSNAPWVRNIYVVTDDQAPDWLDGSRSNLRVVNHKEIFSEPGMLPVSNPHAVESQLHHIDGLAEHFLYVNDDMFIGRPLIPQAFFLANGLSRFLLSSRQVPLGPVTPGDSPVDAACKNNRRLLERKFGVTVTRASARAPHPLRRSVLSEIEAEFPQEYGATTASRIPDPQDLSPASGLYHHYAYQSGRAVSGSVRYGYIHLAVSDLGARLNRLLARRDWDAFCLDDARSTEEGLAFQRVLLLPFLKTYFPVASPFERS
jgi:hypothetical protein